MTLGLCERNNVAISPRESFGLRLQVDDMRHYPLEYIMLV